MKLFVYASDVDETRPVGHAFTQTRRGRLSSTFAYDADYLATTHAYALEPSLPLALGNWPLDTPLPRIFLDAAPDRWGRNLIDRRIAATARATHTAVRTATELDYLLGVSDIARQGALRFKTALDGPFEHPMDEVPKLVALPVLLAASRSVAIDAADADEAVRTLLDLGSASLGGARPKAVVRDGGRLRLAKFAHPHDRWNVIAWEKTALDLAELAGIAVPARELLDVEGHPVLLVDRFDRTDDGHRVGYMSALTLCEADDGTRRDYLELAERLTGISAATQDDLAQLWRRIAFGIAINNTDDHLRNHGFLRSRRGWRLSPAFDLNPDPDGNRTHATPMGGASLARPAAETLVATADAFGLSRTQAKRVAGEVVKAAREWRTSASRNRLAPAERDRFAPVFDLGAEALDDAVRQVPV